MLVLGQNKEWKEKSRCVPGSDVGQLTVERGIRVRGRYMFAGCKFNEQMPDNG